MSRQLDDWIKAYLAYTNENESPEAYHTWIAISAIAGVLRRNVWFDMGYFSLYPNLYVVLVSPAGLCKKSTAMRISRPLLAEVPGINFSVDSISRERLIQDLAQSFQDDQSAMTAYQSEFASMLTTSGMDMVVFLTDIYDSPHEWVHKTKASGTNTIKKPFLNMIAGTTPDWVARAMPLDTIGIGLTSRVIFVYSDTPRVRPAFPTLSSAQHALVPMLKNDLTTMSTIKGQFELADDAREMYENWYQHKRHEEKKDADSRLAGYFERKPMHVLKVAMCVAASKRDGLVITTQDLVDGMGLLAATEDGMPRVFAGVGKNVLALDIEMIYANILANPDGISFGSLLDMFKHSIRKEELEEVLETLRMIGKVQALQDDKRGIIYLPLRKSK
jgi:hypothetical protein